MGQPNKPVSILARCKAAKNPALIENNAPLEAQGKNKSENKKLSAPPKNKTEAVIIEKYHFFASCVRFCELSEAAKSFSRASFQNPREEGGVGGGLG